YSRWLERSDCSHQQPRRRAEERGTAEGITGMMTIRAGTAKADMKLVPTVTAMIVPLDGVRAGKPDGETAAFLPGTQKSMDAAPTFTKVGGTITTRTMTAVSLFAGQWSRFMAAWTLCVNLPRTQVHEGRRHYYYEGDAGRIIVLRPVVQIHGSVDVVR